jgi:hypothetical protein
VIAGVSLVELAAVATFITTIVGILAALKVLPGQRGELRIGREQGAATIRDSFIASLQRDLERKNDELERQDRLIAELREETEGLRRRAGTRKSDPPSDDEPTSTSSR